MRGVLIATLAAAIACTVAGRDVETTVRLAVPREIASNAAAPVLKLEGFETIAGARMRLEVLGPKRELLGMASLVGSSSGGGAVETMDLVIPLNARAPALLSNRDEVTLTLRLRRGRHPLKWKRAFLTTG